MGKTSATFYQPQDLPVTGEAKDQIWLRWDGEPGNDYARFQCYRDLPPGRRNLSNAYCVWMGRPFYGADRREKVAVPQSWTGLSRKWRWDERSVRCDTWKEKSQLEAERDGTLQAWKEMGERHAREAMALQQKALERLRSLNPAELSAAEVRQFLVQAATLERLARGASLQDMARVQREQEEAAAREGVAVITYVDDWRGDGSRKVRVERTGGRRNPDSFYGNGQGMLPEPTEEDEHGRPIQVPLVTPYGGPVRGRIDAEVSVPAAPPGPDDGARPEAPVHLPRRRAALAQDDPGDDAGGPGGDPG